MWLMRNAPATPDNAAAGATDYMHLMGLVALGYMWCRMVEAALARLALDDTAARMRGKLATGRFFVERMLPETAVHLARIRLGAGNLMELPAEAF
jgi:acyl-CoA dehydrogenase